MASETDTSGQPDAASQPQTVQAPQISLPKGGGALQGIGEKFSTNAMTGTGSFTVPIAVSSARSGFTPQLLMSYDSGASNGVFGMGGSLSLPCISRKTDKGLPRYRDDDESDVFILSGSDDLVAVLRHVDGHWERDAVERDGFHIQRYRPRIEGLFARIERWTRLHDGDIHWRSFTKDNVQTIYGDTAQSRISDPERPQHVFSWLVSCSYDGKGNASCYEYVAENLQGVDSAAPGERGRPPPANRYLKRVLYGNRTPLGRYQGPPRDHTEWMFEVVFDFGDEDYRLFRGGDEGECVRLDRPDRGEYWPVRLDPFSTYRSGFEVRTYRLCRRALMFHRFPRELGEGPYLVRSTEFHYQERRIGSLLTRVVQSGCTRLENGTYRKRSLPPVDLSYSRSPLEDDSPGPFELQDAESANLPEGIDGLDYRWIDLDGEGIAGVLSEQGAAWYYKRNLGQGRFAGIARLAGKPACGSLSAGEAQLLDVAGDGQLDLVELGSGTGGFYERAPDPDRSAGLQSGWGSFRPFRALPRIDWTDPDLRFIDLTGDGIADILITEDVAFRWHPSLRDEGFGSALRVPAPGDEDEGPRVLFSDPAQSIYLADMSGDGLTDIVRIRNGEVCYWPNLGYCRFGSKIVLGQSPWFDSPGLFDSRRVRLADTDGSGPTDILYITADEVHVYLNQSGNSLSPRRILSGLPSPGAQFVSLVDFLGRGTACLVWSSPLRSYGGQPLRYVDLMRGKKPHLLTRIDNNMGVETAIEYTSSTEFYLADKAAGHPWITSLPFPVQVVKRTEISDAVSKHRFVSTRSYHHGYYDGVEREFRGFGRVDQRDAEQFASGTLNEDATLYVPPVLTRTWYHTGIFLGMGRVSRHLSDEYYRPPGDDADIGLPDTVLSPDLLPEEAREACRALKGAVLRQEVYAEDGSEQSDRPYSATESNSTVRLLQPRGVNLHCVFFTHPREALTLNFERRLYEVDGVLRADPRIAHALTLSVDEYGNVLQSASVAYGRRFEDRGPLLTASDRAHQGTLLATFTESRYTNTVQTSDNYLTPRSAQARAYQLLHLRESGFERDAASLLSVRDIRRCIARAGDGFHDLPFEDVRGLGATEPHPYRRLFQESRTLYRSDSLERLLPLGEIESLALPGERYSLTLTPELVRQVYGDKLPEPGKVLGATGGFVDIDGDERWWTPSGRVFYSPNAGDDARTELFYARRHFFLPHRFRDPFGNVSYVMYDPHDLAPIRTADPLSNIVQARLDYRVLRAAEVTDPNGNRSQVAFDTLGRVVGTAIMGKAGESQGDSLKGFITDLPERVLLEHLRDPLTNPRAVLGNATTRLLYDQFAFDRTRGAAQPQPAVSYTLARETHVSDLAPGTQLKLEHTFAYSDGFGRQIQSRGLAEAEHRGPRRWVSTGWTIFNNKGKPVRKFEPFFSPTHLFEFAAISGVASTLLYDPIGRVAATLHPNHTFEKTVVDPWYQETWDVNDTVLIEPLEDSDVGPLLRRIPPELYSPTWHEQRIAGARGVAEQDAARKTELHAGTPGRTWFDVLARTLLSAAENRIPGSGSPITEFHKTRFELDIQGNVLVTTDPLGRAIMSCDYDVLQHKVRQRSGDAGERWTVSDIGAKPLLTFNSREFRLRYEYDPLRRPTTLHVRVGEGPERLAESMTYGESAPDAVEHNLLTRPYRQLDGAGVVTTPIYDFKGNLLRKSRQMLVDFRHEVDWGDDPRLEAEVYSSETTYDALNRPVTVTAPDGTVVRPTYNERNLLRRLEVSLKSPDAFAPYVDDITYNAKGQREVIRYGNGAHTRNEYDPLTFMLTHLKTARTQHRADIQDLSYTYDPVGNVTYVRDSAQQTIYFKNQVVNADGDYLYDAVYRLLEASGREHDSGPTNWDDVGRVHLHLPGDAQSMRHYREHYRYDAVGNILQLLHSAGQSGTWRREYEYGQISVNNHLTHTRVGQLEESYAWDPDGNMMRMPHLPTMRWDFKDELIATQTQRVEANGEGPTTVYRYDSTGQRVRKVTEGERQERRAERLYIGNFEVYREYDGKGERVTLERTTFNVMDNARRIALIETSEDEVAIRYQFENHLGSCCLELDETAAVITYEEYYPYGSTSYQAGRSRAEVSLKRYRFLAKERDHETGLSYHGLRYYASWLGRWTSCDPVGIDSTLNGLAYGRCNPMRFVDPSGADDVDKYGWPKGASFVSPDITSTIGTQAHADILPVEQARINASDYFSADTEVRTLPGGSKTLGSWASGEIDLRVFTTQGNRILDLKPYGNTENAWRQTWRYALFDDTVTNSRANDRPPTDYAPDFFDPVQVQDRNYLLFGDENEPYRFDYYLYKEVQTATPTVYLKSPPLAGDSGTSSSGALTSNEPLASYQPVEQNQSLVTQPAPVDMEPNPGNPANGLAPLTQIVPGAGESLLTLESTSYLATRFGLGGLADTALAGAAAPGPAAIGGLAGVPAGYAVENEARQLGLGNDTSVAAGAGGAFLTGAAVAGLAVLAAATAPVSVPVLLGSALAGGLAAGYGYLMSHAMQ